MLLRKLKYYNQAPTVFDAKMLFLFVENADFVKKIIKNPGFCHYLPFSV